MKILIAGASGLIGRHLVSHFTGLGYKVVGLSRSPQNKNSDSNMIWKKWIDNDSADWQQELEDCDAVINLIGESVAGKRWTEHRKRVLLSSRINSCNLLVKAIAETKNRPKTFVQASAIGIYSSGQDQITEDDADKGGNFLADLTVKWEKATEKIEQFAMKRILVRIGLVLSPDSLIITKFKLPFSFFVGGHLGNGQQIMSWIHVKDLTEAISFIISASKESHVFNLTAPNPVSMKDFCKELGAVLGRPSWLHVPAFLLKFIFGKEMAAQTMLSGAAVLPVNLQKLEFTFQYHEIKSALKEIF